MLYPTDENVKDYLCWRQADVHINNLYNTCFWELVKGGETQRRAEELLSGTVSSDKNELLFKRFGINYATLPAMYRKGTILAWKEDDPSPTTSVTPTPGDSKTMTPSATTTTTVAARPVGPADGNKKGWKPTAEEIERLRAEAKANSATATTTRRRLVTIHEDMFEASFWSTSHPGLIPYRSRSDARRADKKSERDEYRAATAAKRATPCTPSTSSPVVSSEVQSTSTPQ